MSTIHRSTATRRASVRAGIALLTVIAASTIVLGSSGSAAEAVEATGQVIAADTTTVIATSVAQPAPQSGPRATATAPREITVLGHGGKAVTLSAKGQAVKRIPRPGQAPATFTGLTAGRAYLVRVGGKSIGSVVALDRPSAAASLSVRTTDNTDSVALSWAHRPTVATGGRSIQYVVTATSPSAPTVTGKVANARSAVLPGLDPSAIYTFTVTPTNSAGSGKATKATMTRSLAAITGTGAGKNPVASAPVADPTPAPPTPTAQPTPAATPAAPAPAPAPSGPRTTTIYVCPDGFATSGDVCQQTRAYTFHTESVPYTYHWGVVGSHLVHHASTDPCNYLPNPNSPSGLDIYCPPGWDETVYDYGNVKDATPTGYTDNGTTWDHQVKDTPPAGFADDGTQYVKTVAKQAQTITL